MDTGSSREVVDKVCAYVPCARRFRAERGDPHRPSFCTMGHWLEARRQNRPRGDMRRV